MRIARIRHTVQCAIRCASAEFCRVHEESGCNGISYLCSCVGVRVIFLCYTIEHHVRWNRSIVVWSQNRQLQNPQHQAHRTLTPPTVLELSMHVSRFDDEALDLNTNLFRLFLSSQQSRILSAWNRTCVRVVILRVGSRVFLTTK